MIKDKTPCKFLLIEDNPGDILLIEELIKDRLENPEILTAKSFQQATTLIQDHRDTLNLILLDNTLPDKAGAQLIREVVGMVKEFCPIIMLTGQPDLDFSKTAIRMGVSDYLIKEGLTSTLLYKSVLYAKERFSATRHLKESEQKFSSIFNLSPQPVWVFEVATLRFMEVNKAAVEMYGYSEEEFLTMTVPEISPTKTLDDFERRIRPHGTSNRNNFVDISKHRKKSGEMIDVEIHSSFMMINNVECRAVIALNITNRIKTEEALRQSEEKYRRAQEIGKMGHWEYDIENGHINWSDEIFTIFNKQKTGPTVNFNDYYYSIVPEDRPAFMKAQQKALKNEKKLDSIHRINTEGNVIKYIHEVGETVTDENNKVIKLIGTVQDVTEQVKNATSLKQSEARLKSIIESQSAYVIRTDLTGNYTYYNLHFFEEFGWIYNTENIIGLNGLTSIVEYHHQKVQETVGLCLASPNEIFQVELDKPGNGNIIRTTLWDFVCLTDEHNNPVEMQCVGIDVTEWKKAERQLIKTLEERNTILESISDGFFALDRNWVITYWNNGIEALSNISRSEMLGKDLAGFFSVPGSVFMEHLRQAFETNTVNRFEYFSPRTKMWLEVSAYPSENGLSIYIKNITRKRQSEEEIKTNERKLQVLFNTVNEVIYLVDIEESKFKFITMNAAGLSALGLPSNEVVGKYVDEVIPSPSLQLVLSKYNEAITTKKPVKWEESLSYLDGIKAARITVSPVMNDNGECILLVGSIYDITDQLAYEEKLKASNAELHQLASHLQNVREDERLHMAREIHDQLGQQLTGIKMDVSWLNRRLKTEDPLIQNKLKETITLIDNTVSTVRKIAADLRPSVLDDLGLGEAINWLNNDFNKRSGIVVNYQNNVDNHKFKPEISIAVFRIYQESLTNISRHAEATKVTCELTRSGNKLQLRVTDNGTGFDQQSQQDKRTLGLVGMKERVVNLHGQFKIESVPGNGTIVDVEIPLNE